MPLRTQCEPSPPQKLCRVKHEHDVLLEEVSRKKRKSKVVQVCRIKHEQDVVQDAVAQEVSPNGLKSTVSPNITT